MSSFVFTLLMFPFMLLLSVRIPTAMSLNNACRISQRNNNNYSYHNDES